MSEITSLLQQSGVSLELIAKLPAEFELQLMDRITESVTDQLDDGKLADLANLTQTNHNQDALRIWLSANIPNLAEIVQDETDILLGDYAANAQ